MFHKRRENYMNSLSLQKNVQEFESMIQTNESVFMEKQEFVGIIDYYEGNFQNEQAILACKAGIEQHPYSAYFLYKLAFFNYEIGKLIQALEYIENAKVLDQTEIEIHFLEATIYTEQNEFKKALNVLYELLDTALEEDIPFVYIELAEIHIESGDFLAAFENLKMALIIQPENESCLDRFVSFGIDYKEQEESIHFLNLLLDENPYAKEIWYYLAQIYKSKDQIKETIESLEFANVIDSDCVDTKLELANCFVSIEEHEKAIEYYLQCLSLKELNTEVFYNLGNSHFEIGNFNKAKYYLSKCISTNGEFAEGHFLLANCYYSLQEVEQSIGCYKKAIQFSSEPEKSEFTLALGNTYFKMSNFSLALEQYAKVLKHNEYNEYIWKQIIQCIIEQGYWSEASEMLEEVVILFPENFEIFVLQSMCSWKTGAIAKSLDALQVALNINEAATKQMIEENPIIFAHSEFGTLLN